MAKVRKDNKGRNLRPGETQRADGSYMYVYKLGTKKKYLYDSDLASLRVKEKQINKDKDDGIRTQEAMKLTLNDMFKVYMNNNIKLKPSTRANYLYLWDFYVKEEPFANMPHWRASTPLFTLRLKWPWTTITSARIPAKAFTASSRRMAALQSLNGGSHSLKRNSRISCVLLPSPLHTAIGSPS